jgi:NAD(P)-dependent dehydrogenase (short-subunit alcohol dehydrogenase family)
MTQFWPNAHALVTGAGSGIGAATAIALAKAGVRVSVAGRRLDALQAVAKSLGDRAGAVVSIDVTDEAAVAKGIAEIEAKAGPIDILVNNAGTADISGGVLNQTEEGWDAAIAVHLTSTMLLSKLAATSMKERGRGKIINLGSMYSFFGAGMLPSYGAAKGGIVQLTKAMAVELAPHGIQVNAIAPGWIATEMTAVARDDPAWAEFNRTLLARTPMGRWGEADECAGAAVFLASRAADFVTGITLPVDGGYSIA